MSDRQLTVAAPAERTIRRLPSRVATAIVASMVGPLLTAPERVGEPLPREPADHHSARRGAHRIVYRTDAETNTVNVIRIDYRADVYRSR